MMVETAVRPDRGNERSVVTVFAVISDPIELIRYCHDREV